MFYMNCSTCFEQEYRETLNRILQHGRTRAVRGFTTKELSPYVWTTSEPLRNILTNKVRRVNEAFMAAEFLWILSGRNDTEMITTYNSKLLNYADTGWSFRGAYGPMVQRQLEYVIKQLLRDLGTRQAVMTIWQPNPGVSKDIPCTLSLQFIYDEQIEALDLVVTMRSNDAWLGLPYDVFNFTMILNYVAMRIGVRIGRYTHQAASEHLYDTNYDIAKQAASQDVIMVKDIKESLPFMKDQLQLACQVEFDLRKSFLQNKLEQLNFEYLAQDLEPAWLELIRRLYEYLLRK
jgi:thymidylate synthase